MLLQLAAENVTTLFVNNPALFFLTKYKEGELL